MIDTPHFRRPPDHPATENELAWIEFLRLLTGDRVPAPRLAHVQGLRNLLEARPSTF